MSWIRVTKKHPCIGCQKDSWCFISEDGLSSLCMRNISGKPYTFTNGDVGYIHRSTDAKPKYIPKKEPIAAHLSTPVLEAMLAKAKKETLSGDLVKLSETLGVKASSLLEIGVAYGRWEEIKDGKKRQYEAWWFPMRDGNGRLVGLRARDWGGHKWAVTGSRQGIFMTESMAKQLH